MNMNKKFIITSLLLFLMFFLMPTIVSARYDTPSNGLEAAINETYEGTNGTTGRYNEKQISEKGFDASTVNFRNIEELNIAIDDLWDFVRWFLSILSVFGTISSFFILTKSFLQLAWIPDHPVERRKVYVDILTSGICTVVFAGLSLFMTVFYKTFQNFFKNSIMLSSDYKSAFALFLVEYKYLIIGIDAVMALTLIIFLIKDIVVLASSGGNPHARASAIKSILITILAIMGCGGVGLIVGMFSGLLII